MVGDCQLPAQSPTYSITPCQLSETAYSVHSQLLFTPGSRLFYPQYDEAPFGNEEGHT